MQTVWVLTFSRGDMWGPEILGVFTDRKLAKKTSKKRPRGVFGHYKIVETQMNGALQDA